MICVWLKETLDRLIDLRSVRVCMDHIQLYMYMVCFTAIVALYMRGLYLAVMVTNRGTTVHLSSPQ